MPQTSNTDVSVNVVDARKKKPRRCDVTTARQKTGDCDNNSPKCDKCGLIHKPKKCPAFGKQCYRCGKDNHYARLCHRAKKVAEIEQDYDGVDLHRINPEHDQYDDSKWFTFDNC